MLRTSEVKPLYKSIEGYVELKRKSLWVRRYAKVENQIFSYKKNRDDRKARGFIDLRYAKVKYSGKPEMESSFIQIKTDIDTIIIGFESFVDYQKWEGCFKLQQDQYNEEQNLRDTIKTQQTKISDSMNQQSSSMREDSKIQASQKSSIAKAFRNDSLTDSELKAAKARLDKESKKQWLLIDGRDGTLVYSDTKGINLSKSRLEIEHLKRCQTIRDKQLSTQKLDTAILVSLVTLFVGVDAIYGGNPHSNVTGIKLFLALSFLGYLSKIVLSIMQPAQIEVIKETNQHQDFNIKAITFLIATPEEISNALTDEVIREQWDPNVKQIFNPSENQLQITYQSTSDENISLQENLKYQFVFDTKQGGTYFIQEQVNGQFFRYYELQPVQNRPYFMRVTFYTPVNSVTFKTRGKDIYRSLNYLKNFISQSNREKSIPIMLKKAGSTSDDSECFTSILNSGFDYSPERNNLSDESEESDQEEIKEPDQRRGQLQEKYQSQDVNPTSSLGKFENNVTDLPIKSIGCITDWESLMPRYKQENIPYIRQAIKTISDFEERLVHPDWKESVDDKKAGLVIWQRTTSDNLRAMKAVGIINRRPIDIFKTIGNDNYKMDYDVNIDFGLYLEKISDQTYFIYQKSKKISIVAPRDFIMILHYNMTPQGVIYIMAFSIDKNELKPLEKGVIRGWINIGGWKLEPVGDDKTKASYMIELDLKGNMPGFVMVQANKEQGYQLVKLRKTVEKFLRENNY